MKSKKPAAIIEGKDVLILTTVNSFGFGARLRILFGHKIKTEIRCEVSGLVINKKVEFSFRNPEIKNWISGNSPSQPPTI